MQFGLASISLHTELVELSVERVDDSGWGRKHTFRSLFDLPVQLVDVLAQPFGIDGNNLLPRLPSFLKNLLEAIKCLVAQEFSSISRMIPATSGASTIEFIEHVALPPKW